MIAPETETHRFDSNSHWITEHCNRGLPWISAGPLLTSIVKFGFVWNLVWLFFVITNWERASPSFLVAWGLVLLWVNLAPFFIWLYDQIVLPRFFARFLELNPDRDSLEEIAKKYSDFFAKPHVFPSIFWAGAILVVAWAGTPVLQNQGMARDGSIFLWLTYVYAIYIGGVLAGPGFKGPLTTILMIREIASIEFEIQPLHPDQLGGLSNVGYCSIRTTLLYSTASLFFPLAFQLSTETVRSQWILGVLSVYILSILLSFIYPTIRINRKAAANRELILADLRDQALQLQENIQNQETDELVAIEEQLELQRVRSKYEDYNDVRLYPFQIDIIVQLAASVLLPVAMLLLELYLKGGF